MQVILEGTTKSSLARHLSNIGLLSIWLRIFGSRARNSGTIGNGKASGHRSKVHVQLSRTCEGLIPIDCDWIDEHDRIEGQIVSGGALFHKAQEQIRW